MLFLKIRSVLVLSCFPVLLLGQKTEVEISSFTNEQPFIKIDSCDQLEYSKRQACADEQMMNFIYTHLEHPLPNSAIRVIVFIRFTIDENGHTDSYEVLRNSSDQTIFEEKAIKVLKLLHENYDWHPGKQYGNAVKVRMVVPVKFNL